MGIEEKLKELINEQYGSVSKFAQVIDVPYTTLVTIFKRGVENAGISNVFKMTKELGISADALLEGRIENKEFFDEVLTKDELDCLKKYRNLDDHGKRQVTTTLNNEYERCSVVNSFDWGQFLNREGALDFLNQRTQTMAFFGGDKDFDSMDDEELLKFAEVLSELK